MEDGAAFEVLYRHITPNKSIMACQYLLRISVCSLDMMLLACSFHVKHSYFVHLQNLHPEQTQQSISLLYVQKPKIRQRPVSSYSMNRRRLPSLKQIIPGYHSQSFPSTQTPEVNNSYNPLFPHSKSPTNPLFSKTAAMFLLCCIISGSM